MNRNNHPTITGKFLHAVSVVLLLLVIWQVAVWFFQPGRWLFPSPRDVLSAFIKTPDYLFSNMMITLKEMVFGLIAGTISGVLVALLLAQFTILDRYLMPVVVATQTLPVFAIAPLLVIWFGYGIGSKIVMAALIIFFPVASAFYDGLKSTPSNWLDLARTWQVSPYQMLVYFRVPAALPSLVTGLKVAAAIAPIGAVVGEWAGASGGLGFVMLQANARTQTATVFAAVILLGISAWVLRWIVVQLTERFIWWAGVRLS